MYAFVETLIKNDKAHLRRILGPGVTILAYLPVSGHELDNGGSERVADHVLVDVGSFANLNVDIDRLILQGPGGFSEAILCNRDFLHCIPSSDRIVEGTQRSYKEMNPCPRRRQLQLEMEVQRMKASPRLNEQGWREALSAAEQADWAPPIGHTISQFPLTFPSSSQLQLEVQPFVGVAYLLLPPNVAMDMRLSVYVMHAAAIAAKCMVRNRIDALLGAMGEGPMRDPDAIARFLCAHHWFYPHYPSALTLLYTISGRDATALAHMFGQHGWPAPPASLLESAGNESCDELVRKLVDDYRQLHDSRSSDRIGEHAVAGLYVDIWNVAIAMAGVPVIGKEYRLAFRIGKAKRIDRIITLAPKFHTQVKAAESLAIPVFGVNSILQYKGECPNDSFLKEAAPFAVRNGQDGQPVSCRVKPKFHLTRISTDGNDVGALKVCNKEKSAVNNWLVQVAFRRLHHQILESEHADNH